MLRTVVLLSALRCLVQGSGIGHVVAPIRPAPIVTSASSQYFERTFNRLVAVPPVLEPVIPVAPAPPVIPIAPPPQVIPIAQVPHVVVEPTRTVPVTPTQNVPLDPNVAIAIATAHAAAPVATILLPPYPFGPPPQLGLIPSAPAVPDESRKESTTPATTFQPSTVRETEQTTPLPLPSNTANAFAQAPAFNQNVNFQSSYGPPPLPLPQPAAKPQKLKTSVEIVPVPLQYIAPPPIRLAHAKPVKLVHKFVPARTKVIVHTVRVPARIVTYRAPVFARHVSPKLQLRSSNGRDIELTTFRPFIRSNTKPPRA